VGECLGDSITGFEDGYDFGDGWMHAVTIEAMHKPTELNLRPYCIAGANVYPPEDAGPMDFLGAILDPRHPQYANMWRWIGGPFDPAGSDINSANERIRKLRY
jgi:hypothetical protein